MTITFEAVDQLFVKLGKALEREMLDGADKFGKPCGKIRCHADDFMLMGNDAAGAHFKNRSTRNYLTLKLNGDLVVYKTEEPFMRGLFGTYHEEGVAV